MIDVLVFACTGKLEAHNRVRRSDQVVPGPTAPGDVVGEVVLMRAIAADGELNVGFEKKRLVTQGRLAAEDSIVGTGPKREVVPVNAALGRAGNFHFVEFFLEPLRVAGRKFHAAEKER